jgi:hypothetical protein
MALDEFVVASTLFLLAFEPGSKHIPDIHFVFPYLQL